MIDPTTVVAHAPRAWADVFCIVSYVMTVGCVYGAIRRSSSEAPSGQKVRAAASQVGIVLFFAFMFWFLESWAHHRTPYYKYAEEFRDLVPRLHVDALGTGLANTCTTAVKKVGSGAIPLSVVLLEATLAYSAMVTARRMAGAVWTQSLLAGLALLSADAVLDPIVSTAHTCGSGAALTPGVGLWHWFLPDSSTLGPNENELATAFKVPAFNYAAWLCAPIVLVSLVNLVAGHAWPWLVESVSGDGARSTSQRKLRDPLVLVGLSLGLLIGFAIAPKQDPRPSFQYFLLGAAVLGALVAFFSQFGQYHADRDFDATLTIPVALAFLLPATITWCRGQWLKMPAFMPVFIVFFGLGLWLAWLPYRKALDEFAEAVDRLDRFTRTHYFGFTAMLVMFGAALSVKGTPGVVVASGLLIVAACFHTYAYVFNDLMDIEVDRRSARRSEDPLVSVAMKKETAGALVATAVLSAILATAYLADFDVRPMASWGSLVALLAAFVLLGIYNVWGKRCPWPWVTDLTQGVGWGSLAFFGMLAASPRSASITHDVWLATTALFVYGAGYIFLINGIHGGLRDLATDNGQSTLAQWFGATTDEDGAAVSNWKIQAFAFSVQAVLAAVSLGFVWRFHDEFVTPDQRTGPWVAGAVIAMVLVCSTIVLWRVVRQYERDRSRWISISLLVLLVPPMVVFLAADRPSEPFKWDVACLFVVPLLLRKKFIAGALEKVYRKEKDAPTRSEPPRRGHSGEFAVGAPAPRKASGKS
jgi:4-hydroxybenzoate polyprenyltransferase